MVIVFVIDNFLSATDGTNITARRFCNKLRERGHEVRVVSIGEPDYPLKERHIPLVSRVSAKQSVRFAEPDEAVLRRAFTGADIVHFFLPWKLARTGERIARQMGIPCTAAFHCQPENVTYNLGLSRLGFVASWLYGRFRRRFYKRFANIHCPSRFIAHELRKHKYRAKLHIISNGVSESFRPPAEPPVRTDDKIHILMIGRLAGEKRQDLIIRAVNMSKYRDRIQLHFAGRGPRQKKLERLGARLPNPPIFGFYTESELVRLIHSCDLYIHAADVEIEAIACIEAISCGKVPVIADSKKSATPQFALDSRSLFTAGSAASLCERMEYWLDNPAERQRMEQEYAAQRTLFSLNHSVQKAEEMFRTAAADHRTQKLAAECKTAKRVSKRVRKPGLVKNLFSRLFYYLVAYPVLFVFDTVFLGLRIRGRKNLRRVKGGAITICNHVHTLDCSMIAIATFPKKPVFTSLATNFKMPVAGVLVSALGAVPVPVSPNEQRVFFYELARRACSGNLIHFYPEGELINDYRGLREFKRGAFYLAEATNMPVIPMVITFRAPRGLYKLKKRPPMTITIGEPVYPNYMLLKADARTKLQSDSEQAMYKLIG